MAERGFGRIIHVGSQRAHRAFVRSGAYGVSKGALESPACSRAEAWPPYGVTRNPLVPGFVMTPLNARLSSGPERVAAPAARTLVGRNGLAEDFAGAAVFLTSRSSAYVTGQTVRVDGGFSVHWADGHHGSAAGPSFASFARNRPGAPTERRQVYGYVPVPSRHEWKVAPDLRGCERHGPTSAVPAGEGF